MRSINLQLGQVCDDLDGFQTGGDGSWQKLQRILCLAHGFGCSEVCVVIDASLLSAVKARCSLVSIRSGPVALGWD